MKRRDLICRQQKVDRRRTRSPGNLPLAPVGFPVVTAFRVFHELEFLDPIARVVHGAAGWRVTYGRILSSNRGPIPETLSKSSTRLYGRPSMIFAANTGPMPLMD